MMREYEEVICPRCGKTLNVGYRIGPILQDAPVICDKCKARIVTCIMCQGSGQSSVLVIAPVRIDCPHCNGKGTMAI